MSHDPAPLSDPPTSDELSQLVEQNLRENGLTAQQRALANDQQYVQQVVARTRRLAQNLESSGLRSHEAWDQALREIALAV